MPITILTSLVGPTVLKAVTQSTNPTRGKTAAEVAAESENKRLFTNMLAYPMDTSAFAQGHYVVFQLHSLTNGKLVKQDAPGGQNRSFALQGATKRVGTQIALYMPPQVSVTYGLKYTDTAISATAEDAGNVAGAVLQGQHGDVAPGAFQSLLGFGQKAAAATSGLAVNTGAAGLKELAFVQSGKIVTDKMELVFEGVDRRTFTFEFTFIPKSPEEANQVFMIVKAFKVAMLPKYTESFGSAAAVLGIGGNLGASFNSGDLSLNKTTGVSAGDAGRDRTLTIPTTMDIKYYMQQRDGTAKENGYLNKISTCYLKNLEIKYGGDRYTAYEEDARGASPQSTSITMTFNEIEIITQEAAMQGY